MSIESTTNINGLNEATPTGEDSKSEGDNHVRLLKVVLRSTFPGFSGRFMRVTIKSANYTAGLTDNGSILKFTAGATISGVPSTLGNGWMAIIYNAATTNIVIDPTGAVLVNGQATLNVAPKSAIVLLSDGTAFIAFGVPVPMSGVSVGSEFAAGTRLVFPQSTAPSGWTLLTNTEYNNAALRLITSGAAGFGGTETFSAVMNGVTKTEGLVLQVAHLPPHNHPVTINSVGNVTHTVTLQVNVLDPDDSAKSGTYVAAANNDAGTLSSLSFTTSAAGAHTHTASSSNTGSGVAHDHNIGTNLKYVDSIIAEKQ